MCILGTMPGCLKAKDGQGVALVHGPCQCLCMLVFLCVFNCTHTAVRNDAIMHRRLGSLTAAISCLSISLFLAPLAEVNL